MSDELAREYNHYAEQAAELFLAGRPEQAHQVADRAVAAGQQLHKSTPENRAYANAYADACRNRAEFATVLILGGHEAPRRLAMLGARDAGRALDLYEPGDPRTAAVCLNLAELLTVLGQRDQARVQAETALADYRRRQVDATELARALDRYADVLSAGLPSTPPEAVQARLESVRLARPFTRPGTHLWTDRHNQENPWLSRPTLHRFGVTARRLAADLPRPGAEAARCLFDAAEVELALIDIENLYAPAHPQRLRTAGALLEELAQLLDDRNPDLARRCRTSGLPDDWLPDILALRPEVEAAFPTNGDQIG
ncbi:hypothetical protein [Paractinoplanes lichenicola]|uniref:Tetratricopeptide repeat protein n=1 Tax=Paractinoplanes lichenicola TaxID=2802976 RepID=A0ABS1VUG1_9ACTN|nr:hypothetical protein [Actinoplanes lichenicola]MBL7258085.1 hypothetical protein [Actinoplanes lichenicola]